nr:hypothetical protein [Tanacetum cinerariifolium]GFB09496.1 hypothetical protein [Tanacetum cinerariifolium]
CNGAGSVLGRSWGVMESGWESGRSVLSTTSDERLEILEVKVSSFDGISFRSPGKQLAKSCEAKSLDI